MRITRRDAVRIKLWAEGLGMVVAALAGLPS